MPPVPPPQEAPLSLAEFLSAMTDPAAMPPWFWWYWAVVFFLFGLLFGSFFNVCIYRIPVGKSIVRPGSHCYSCGTFLKWYDNIPLVSYLLLRGNCRACGSHFSPRYFFVELLCGLMFLAFYVQFGLSVVLPFHLAFASLLFVGIFTDIDHFILPDGVTIGGFFFAVAVAALLGPRALIAEEYLRARDLWQSFNPLYYQDAPTAQMAWWVPLAWSLASGAFGWLMLWGIGFAGRHAFGKEAMGAGDIKLFAFLGAYMGLLSCIWILFLSALLGSVLGVSFLLAHKLRGGDKYEPLELAPIPAGDPRLGHGISQRSESGGGIALMAGDEPGQSPEPAEITELPASPEPLKIRIASRTKHQVHSIPYGPYIAVAALALLLWHEDVSHWLHDFLMLSPLPELTQTEIPAME